ncbi:MAG: ABC-F family ATP-binding cassette domain-containing protein [Candidatus Eremiobacteraeota bacterium]|nr:ABC-F family ATP-binding cassette domain-containing protein [Candidatus Eremiobacteraeota bacterium]
MEYLRFTGLECHYGAREIFSDLSGVVHEGERIALVGPNGAGKSSLLRLLAGVDMPYGGTIVRAKDAKLGYLAQSVADETQATLQQLVDAALDRVSDAEWGRQNKTLRTMLTAFGFALADYERPLREFSGGQRAKAALAHLLIDNPEYLILDEPTNHLDIGTVRWLESFIAADKRTYMIVSHDRYFIDQVATRVWEIEGGRFHTYAPAHPAYTEFLAQKDLRLEEERRAYSTFVTERDKRRETIADLRATLTSSNYSRVRSREKQLARVEATMQAPEPTGPRARINVRLQSTRRAGNGFAFELKDLSKAYAEPLFAGLAADLQQGERLAIVGPNGAGKSTLLKILAGELKPDTGSVRFNPASQTAYFAQSAHDELDVDETAVEVVLAAGTITPEAARALLGRMRISGDAADKPVRAFSGGERRRIMLARLMARKADVLLLDEPTNDLDIESREALEGVLDDYEGALVVVSHDRYLLARLSDLVLWIDDGAWGLLEGGYDAYEALMREREEAARESVRDEKRKKTSRLTPLKVRSNLEAQIARAEREIAKLDVRKVEIEALFEDPDLFADRARVRKLQEELASIGKASEVAVKTWEKMLAEFEELTRTG